MRIPNLFRPKTMRRMCVFLAMLAPIFYLFGGLFFGLAGAHGEQVFADDATPYVWTEETSILAGDESRYRLTFTNDDRTGILSALAGTGNVNVCTEPYYLNGIPRQVALGHSLLASSNSGDYKNLYSYPAEVLPFPLITSAGVVNYAFPWVFEGSSTALNQIHSYFAVGKIERYSEMPSDVAFTHFVFGDFFYKDNFLVSIGEDMLSENPHGFAPFAEFWKYLDVNILHIGDMQLGLMGYGYLYYACHVLLFDLGFMLVTFFLSFIQKVADKFGGDER